MTIETNAIYENGLLRPISPLPFSEHQQVFLRIEPQPSSGQAAHADTSDEWLAKWRQLQATMPRSISGVDDSRETIYGDGE